MTNRSAAPNADPARRRPLPPSRPHLIRSDAEALQVAHGLAEPFGSGAAERKRTRRLPWSEIEQYTAAGWAALPCRGHMAVPKFPIEHCETFLKFSAPPIRRSARFRKTSSASWR
jgi:hypothetical protein